MELILREKWIPNVLNLLAFQVSPRSERGKFEDPTFEPIQIASDLVKLILHPEHKANLSNVSNKLKKEPWEPSRKQVESSAKREIFNLLKERFSIRYPEQEYP